MRNGFLNINQIARTIVLAALAGTLLQCSDKPVSMDVDAIDFRQAGLYMRVYEPRHGMRFDLPNGWRRGEPPPDADGTRWDGAFRAPKGRYLLRIVRRKAEERPFDYVMANFARKRVGVTKKKDIQRLLKSMQTITPKEAKRLGVDRGVLLQITRNPRVPPAGWGREYIMAFQREGHYYLFSFLARKDFGSTKITGGKDGAFDSVKNPVYIVARTLRFGVKPAAAKK